MTMFRMIRNLLSCSSEGSNCCGFFWAPLFRLQMTLLLPCMPLPGLSSVHVQSQISAPSLSPNYLSFFFKNMFCIVPSNGSRGKKTKSLAHAISCDLHNNLGSRSQSFHWHVKNRSFLSASSVSLSQIIYITFMGFESIKAFKVFSLP